MIPLWRLTRNAYARQVYELLGTVGITATRMIEFTAETSDSDGSVSGDAESDVTLAALPPDAPELDRLDLDFSIPVTVLDGEWVVVATADGDTVGRALVSSGADPYVDPLRTRMTFDGAYVRRVYVGADWRNRGIATRLVRRTLTVAATEFDAATASALVAADNRPSQWVFESTGFERTRRHDYARLFGLEYRRTVDLP